MLTFRKAVLGDSKLYFDWANDSIVRKQSFKSITIDIKNHKNWFKTKLEDDSCIMLLFQNEEEVFIGQVRIQKENKFEAIIGISIAAEHRGKGYAKDMLVLASEYFFKKNIEFLINAYIKVHNLSSKKAFEKAGFEFNDIINYKNFNSFHFTKKFKNENR